MGEFDFRHKHLLMVDDNEINRLMGKELLAQVGFSVACAENGQEAVDRVKQGGVDIVLMDIEMPVMDGLVATEQIRALPGPCRQVPIIAMTAASPTGANKEDKARCLAAGMSDYLTKPLDMDRVLPALSQWLNLEVSAQAPASTEQAGLVAVEGLDYAGALKRLRGKRQLLHEMIGQFINANQSSGERLTQFIEQGAYKEAERLAHTLKGTGANLGFVDIESIAQQIEEALKAGATAIAPALLDKLSQQFQYLGSQVDLFTTGADDLATGTSFSAAGTQVERQAVCEQVLKVKQTIGADLSAAEQHIQGLLTLTQGTEYEAMATDIHGAFKRFDMSGVRQVMEKFLC